jgi:hypothetical protein
LGDLGGSKGIGSHGIKDLRVKPTRPSLSIGYKYMITPAMSVRAIAIWGYLSGDDALTQNTIRNNRNLSLDPCWVSFLLCLNYPGGDRVVPNYKVTGIAEQNRLRSFHTSTRVLGCLSLIQKPNITVIGCTSAIGNRRSGLSWTA